MVIRLFCAAGMSTSLLVKKMEEAAKEKGKDAAIATATVEGEVVTVKGVKAGATVITVKDAQKNRECCALYKMA